MDVRYVHNLRPTAPNLLILLLCSLWCGQRLYKLKKKNDYEEILTSDT